MDLSKFLDEAERVRAAVPKKDENPTIQKLRKAGDVGKADALSQVTGKPVQTAAAYKAAGRQVAKDTGFKYDDDGVDPNTTEDPNLPKRTDTARRMSAAFDNRRKLIQTGQVNPDMESGVDMAMDAAQRRARAGSARSPLMTRDAQGNAVVVPDTGYARHAYQPAGMEIGKNLGAEDIDKIIYGTIDKDEEQGDKLELQNRSGVETTRIQRPSARDLEAMDSEAERLGAGKEDRKYLTPEVMQRQAAFRDALNGQDSKRVQELAFQHEVSDDAVKQFIDAIGYKRAAKKGEEGRAKILTNLELNGISDAKRQKEAYGGDLGKEGEPYKNENGTYDLTKMPKELRKKALNNRGLAMVRTYLQQGGRDAYAQHEGLRSIEDMDLEHIASLTAGGVDDPSNWVWASGELNRLRGNKDMGPSVRKYGGDEDDIRDLGGGVIPGQVADDPQGAKGKIFRQFRDDPRFAQEFGTVGKKGENTGLMKPENLAKMSQDEVEQLRQKFMQNYGGSEEQAKTLFPDRGRMTNLPYAAGRDEYDKDMDVQGREAVMFNNIVQTVKNLPQYKGKVKTEADVFKTPEGRALRQQLVDGQRQEKPAAQPARRNLRAA